jgi:hypothetical protein
VRRRAKRLKLSRTLSRREMRGLGVSGCSSTSEPHATLLLTGRGDGLSVSADTLAVRMAERLGMACSGERPGESVGVKPGERFVSAMNSSVRSSLSATVVVELRRKATGRVRERCPVGAGCSTVPGTLCSCKSESLTEMMLGIAVGTGTLLAIAQHRKKTTEPAQMLLRKRSCERVRRASEMGSSHARTKYMR